MVVIDLIKHQWKQGVRSRGFHKNLLVNIIMGVFVLYMASMFLLLGFFLGDLLAEIDTPLNPVELFTGAILWVLVAGLFIRFFMQQLNTMNMPAYQILPTKRSTLIHFLVLKPLVSPFNYISFLLVIPFAIRTVSAYYGGITALVFVVNLMLLIWFNSLFAAFLKRKFGPKIWSIILLLAVIAVLALLESMQWFSLFSISVAFFGFLTKYLWGTLLLCLLPITAFILNKHFFAQNYYPETFNKNISKSTNVSSVKFSFLDRFGLIGELMSMELKLLLRHKRTKSMLYLSVFFLFYGLIFYTNDIYKNNTAMLFFAAIFITGFMMIMYGQWVVSWDSTHFDALMTKNIPIRTYMDANYYLMAAFNMISFVLTTPYFFFGKEIAYLQIAAFLFNIGINIPILLYFAPYNRKRIELSQANAFNYQGTTYKSFLIIIPILLLPILLVTILSALFTMVIALWAIAILGIVGLLCHKPILSLCVKQFNAQKYKMAEGFREHE